MDYLKKANKLLAQEQWDDDGWGGPTNLEDGPSKKLHSGWDYDKEGYGWSYIPNYEKEIGPNDAQKLIDHFGLKNLTSEGDTVEEAETLMEPGDLISFEGETPEGGYVAVTGVEVKNGISWSVTVFESDLDGREPEDMHAQEIMDQIDQML
jgi:hypothetical protein